jgi:hypothetical protein
MEGGGIAMQIQIADRDGLTAQREGTQLLIGGVGVVANGVIGGEERERQDKQEQPRQ